MKPPRRTRKEEAESRDAGPDGTSARSRPAGLDSQAAPGRSGTDGGHVPAGP